MTLKEDNRKQLESYENVPNALLISTERENDSCEDEELEERAAREVAVTRVRRLARDHHSGKERAQLEFTADIVGVKNKSTVGTSLVQ